MAWIRSIGILTLYVAAAKISGNPAIHPHCCITESELTANYSESAPQSHFALFPRRSAALSKKYLRSEVGRGILQNTVKTCIVSQAFTVISLQDLQ